MKCIECNSDKAITILIEIFPCIHCNKDINMEYNLCPDCGATWKTMNGKLFDGSTIADANLDELLGVDGEIDDFFESLVSNLEKDLLSADENSMRSLIHRCLKCNSIAYEVDENLYRCPNCGFEWEITIYDE